MNIFLTGATGYIGDAVATALRKAGHEVTALVRPEADTRHLRDLGVALLAGDLESLPSLASHLDAFDTFVHAAQSHTNAADANRIALETYTSKSAHLIFTSGVWVLGNTKDADESSPVNPLALVSWRPAQEELALGAGGAVIRPGCVYGGRQSLAAGWFASAEQNEPLKIVGDGENRWAMVDLHELADLYLRTVEQRASGMLHGIDDTRATLNECARAIAPTATIEHVDLEAARAKFGGFADALAIDQIIDSSTTRKRLGWNPKKTFTNSISEQWQEWKQSRSAAG
jgi:nucleoside-diphosphate-sugar epimerase